MVSWYYVATVISLCMLVSQATPGPFVGVASGTNELVGRAGQNHALETGPRSRNYDSVVSQNAHCVRPLGHKAKGHRP